jgi:hypothetical protein
MYFSKLNWPFVSPLDSPEVILVSQKKVHFELRLNFFVLLVTLAVQKESKGITDPKTGEIYGLRHRDVGQHGERG